MTILEILKYVSTYRVKNYTIFRSSEESYHDIIYNYDKLFKYDEDDGQMSELTTDEIILLEIDKISYKEEK